MLRRSLLEGSCEIAAGAQGHALRFKDADSRSKQILLWFSFKVKACGLGRDLLDVGFFLTVSPCSPSITIR